MSKPIPTPPRKEEPVAPIVQPKSVQKAVDDLIEALGYPAEEISRIEISCAGTVRLWMRNRAVFQGSHVRPFRTEEDE